MAKHWQINTQQQAIRLAESLCQYHPEMLHRAPSRSPCPLAAAVFVLQRFEDELGFGFGRKLKKAMAAVESEVPRAKAAGPSAQAAGPSAQAAGPSAQAAGPSA